MVSYSTADQCDTSNCLSLLMYYIAADVSERRSRALSTVFRNREDPHLNVARILLVLSEVSQDFVLLVLLLSYLEVVSLGIALQVWPLYMLFTFITPWLSRWPRGLMCIRLRPLDRWDRRFECR